jgi:hypothetical protein
MTKIEKLEQEIASLSADELSEFRRWFAAFDARAWDEQIERDVQAGALDALAGDAIVDHRAGRSRPL